MELLRGGAGSFSNGTGRVTWADLSRPVNLWAQPVPTSLLPTQNSIPYLGFYVISSSLDLSPHPLFSHIPHPNPFHPPHLFPIVLPPSPSSSSLPPQSRYLLSSLLPLSPPFSSLSRCAAAVPPVAGRGSPEPRLAPAVRASCEVRWEEAAACGRRAPGTVRAGGWCSHRIPAPRPSPPLQGQEPRLTESLRRPGCPRLRDDKARDAAGTPDPAAPRCAPPRAQPALVPRRVER